MSNPAPTSSAPTENRRVLIVDDEPEIRAGYKSALNPQAAPVVTSSRVAAAAPSSSPAASRFEIVEASSGEEALDLLLAELAQGRHFAGAIVDVRMPGRLDGLQFIREAWKSDPGLLVVVATAYQDRSVDEIDRIFSLQFQDQWDYLNKPFTQGEIVQKARQLVSSWNRRERERQYISRIQEQQQALVAQERLAAIGRLARSVGHEFGNILQPLITKIEIARRKGSDDMHPIFDEMLEAAELGSHICQDLLVFARENPDSSAVPEIQIKSAVDRTLRIIGHNLKKKDAKLHVAVADDLLVRCHEPRLVQVIVNLLTNSLDALPMGGEIRIEGVRENLSHGAVARLSVSDTGAGIPLDVQGLVFLPLFTTKGARGNGLGLSVCRQIVESYGGRIFIDSTPGKGTQVTLSLPALQNPS
jgi:signal transduction histidine kinase